MKTITYTPRGVCARRIELTLDNEIVKEVKFIGGCSGNTQGVAALAAGMPAAEVIARLSGIRCGFKTTSCPDQLAKALQEALVANDDKITI